MAEGTLFPLDRAIDFRFVNPSTVRIGTNDIDIAGLGEDELLPLVYDELRRLARLEMSNEAPQTLSATALVHEAYLRLRKSGESDSPGWKNRRHFFGAAAEAMRRILIDRSRARAALKRGGDLSHEDRALTLIQTPADEDQIDQVNEALDAFASVDPECAELVKLKYFVGLSWGEIAEITGESTRTVNRRWTYAKAWLHDAISRGRE